MKLWSKDSTSTSQLVEQFTVGRDKEFDVLLAPYDVQGNKAHAAMLASVGLITSEENLQLQQALDVLYDQVTVEGFVLPADVEDIHSYVELLLVALLLGIGGASFAVTLPLAGRTYPAAHQGLVLGIVASGNVGTVLVLFLAPRIAAMGGWHDVFGWMTLPIIVVFLCFMSFVRDDRKSRRDERNAQWWHNVAVMIRHPKAYWLCGLYAVTFGGFVGFCSILPLFFHDQYRLDGITAGSIVAVSGLVGSLIRPLGGYAADRIGGLRALMLSLPLIIGVVAVLGEVTGAIGAISLVVVAVGAMGVGNGIILQLASEWFSKQIGLASGIVGAAGGIGGFLLPLWLGTMKEVTGSYRTGLWMFAVVTAIAWGTVLVAQRRARRVLDPMETADPISH